ncbi:MAG TPA: hypothetical protein VNJ11_10975 [Bryobacteraceae bacterium]|nr:hypothetical protein [Bryobacteraceae bacterium]
MRRPASNTGRGATRRPHRKIKVMDWFWIVLLIAGWLLVSRFTGG